MWTDFNNSFTVAFVDELQKKGKLHQLLKYVATLPWKL